MRLCRDAWEEEEGEMGEGGEESMLSDGSPFTKEEETSEGGRRNTSFAIELLARCLAKNSFTH